MIVAGFGQGASVVDLELDAADPERVARTHALAAAVRAAAPGADVVVGGSSVLAVGVKSEALGRLAQGALGGPAPAPPAGRAHVLSTVYDGPDLDELAAATGLLRAEVIALHAGREYVVELVGFLPGFAYLGELDPRLVTPRRASPRPVVPAGSVAVAGRYTGVYPFASPGGWTLLGRAVNVEPALFDPRSSPPGRLQPGDTLRFAPLQPYDAPPPEDPRAEFRTQAAAEQGTHLASGVVVVSAPPGATVQDGGRPGRLAAGLPPSGALDPTALALANAAAGNAPGAAAVEIPLGALELEARGEVLVSVDGEPARRLADGERFRVEPGERAVRYLAVRGGLDVPVVLGSRSTLLVARIGGLEGRALRRGDVLRCGNELAGPARGGDTGALEVPRQDGAVTLEIDPGPHLSRFPEDALATLLGSSFQVSRLGNRVGVRLEGPPIPREGPDLGLPAPMRRGALQITSDGVPIAFGPDHPTTGGYPVLAALREGSQHRLARLRPGERVMFRRGR